jgi:hypothetical protein
MDIGWAMDKKQGMTWFTFPRANFGIFLVKACPLSIKASKQASELLSVYCIPAAAPPIPNHPTEPTNHSLID